MKKVLNLIIALMAVLHLSAQEEGVITLTTNQEVNTSVKILAWGHSLDEPINIDWGDGKYVTYNINPSAMTWAKWIRSEVKGKTITIKGNLVYFEYTEGGLTSVEVNNMNDLSEVYLADNDIETINLNDMPVLTKLDLSNNKIASFSTKGMTQLDMLKLSGNQITSFSSEGAPAIKTLDLSNNKLTYMEDLDIKNLADTLENLNVQQNNLQMLNLIDFSRLIEFEASDNPELSTVVFNDGNANMKSIKMENCYIMHFYGISLPSLSTLYLTNNALMDLEKGSYPKLERFRIAGNYINELDLSECPELFEFSCDSNYLETLDLGANKKLNTLYCSKNKFKHLDLTNNKEIRRLNVSNNSDLRSLDISKLSILSELDISNTKISYIDLSSAYYLKFLMASNTECSFFNFNYIAPKGQFQKVDIRNNKNMNANTINFTLHTMPQREWKENYANIFLEGSNAEHAFTDYINSKEMQWTTDVNGDGTSQYEEVSVDVKAELTGNMIEVTGSFGGIVSDQTFTFSEYATTNGKFTISQWCGEFFQQLADVNGKAMTGVPMHITPMPAEGYVFDGVIVNGTKIQDEWFVINEAATIEVRYRMTDAQISFTTGEGQALSFALIGDEPNTPVQIDWGNGAKEEFNISNTGWKRIDGSAKNTTITIYGNVVAANFESFGEFGEEMGVWNNKITSIDLSNNPMLEAVNLYMNPIKTLDVSNLPKLRELDCSYCELSSINVTGLPELAYLSCYGNTLAELDVTKNPSLFYLNAKNNQLTSLDLSNNSNIVELRLNDNMIDSVTVNHMSGLTVLDVADNKLTTLDLSKNPELTELSVARNQLTELNLDVNTQLTSLLFNGNNIKWIDLHNNDKLISINACDNGMTACELDDFYFNLPQFPELTDEEKEQIKGFTLMLYVSADTNPNDADHSDTNMATAKGWLANASGDASGCDMAHIVIADSENGSIELTDNDGNVINSGDKVAKNSNITITATPEVGFELDKVTKNGNVIEGTTFSISRYAIIQAMFREIATGISSAELDGVTVESGVQNITVTVSERSSVQIYNTNGMLVYNDVVEDITRQNVGSGIYVVKVKNNAGIMTRMVTVK